MHGHEASIRVPKLDCNSLRITGYNDAAFANNVDSSSQLGRIALLTDDNHNSIAVSYKSCKPRRVTRSVLSAEVIAFADLFDGVFAIRKQLKLVLRQPILVYILTDSKSLLDIMSKGSRTSKKLILLNIYKARQAYKAQGITNIVFIRNSHNLADGLSKPKAQAELYQLLTTCVP